MGKLSKAAKNGDVEEVKKLLHERADPNENIGSWQRTPLHECALNGSLEITKLLVAAGGDLKAKYGGNSVVHDSVREQNGDLALWMLTEAKADPRDLNGFGNTLLHLAALYGQFQVVKYLCEKVKMSPNEFNQSGATAMQCAFAGGQIEIIRYFTIQTNKAMLQNCSMEEMNYKLAQKFLKNANRNMSALSLSNLCLIPTKQFLEAGRIPVHEECAENGWVCDGHVLNTTSKVLFLSHRWQTAHAPDPENIQFNMFKEFIETCNVQFDYIWADYSCITQVKTSALFLVHLQNIPTALFCATHCIVIPAVFEDNTSDLSDYLGRGWCQLEAMVAIFTGCETFIAYKSSELVQFPKLEPFRGFTLPGGFKLSSEKAQRNIQDGALKRKAKKLWDNCSEPVANMKQFVDGCIVIHKDHMDLFNKILSMSITEEDVNQFEYSGNTFLAHLPEAYRNIGNFTSNDDRIVVARLLLFCMAYSMYEFEEDPMVIEEIESVDVPIIPSNEPIEEPNKSAPANEPVKKGPPAQNVQEKVKNETNNDPTVVAEEAQVVHVVTKTNNSCCVVS